MDLKGKHPYFIRLGLVAAASLLIILTRKPDAFFNAQFWAEDGVVWYQQAYETGWKSLLLPQNGYFQTVSKLTAVLAQRFPLAYAPLLFNLVSAAFKILPVLLVFSSRSASLFSSIWSRVAVCSLYLAHPYSWEVFLNVTNIHWHLALAALVLLYFESWPGLWRKLVDAGVMMLCGLSGTFALFLAPIAAWRWYRSRSRRALVLGLLLAATAMIQLAAIITTASGTRSAAQLDASLGWLVRIVGGQIGAAGLLGEAWVHLFATTWWNAEIALPLAFGCFAALIFARAWWASKHPALCGLTLLAAMVFVAALASPQISSSQGQWPLFAKPGVGGRYVFIPIVALHAALLWVATGDQHRIWRRAAALALAVVVLVAIPASWRIPPYRDFQFVEHAARFEASPPGTIVEIPINPVGWSLRLRKKEQ